MQVQVHWNMDLSPAVSKSTTRVLQVWREEAVNSGVFKGGHGAMPPLWPDHENFLQATFYEKVRFCHFPARMAKFNNV